MRFDNDDSDSYSRPALRRDWRDEGIGLGQVAVELPTGEGQSPTVLERSYDVNIASRQQRSYTGRIGRIGPCEDAGGAEMMMDEERGRHEQLTAQAAGAEPRG